MESVKQPRPVSLGAAPADNFKMQFEATLVASTAAQRYQMSG